MSSDAIWKQDAIGVEHPSHEAILAFIREQCAEDEKTRIDEHLLTGCVPCNRIHTVLKQDSNSLNQFFDMSDLLYYRGLQSNQVLLHMQRGVPLTSAWTGKRKRKFQVQSQLAGRHPRYRAGLRAFRFSVPVAFGLILLFTTVAVVLAYGIVNIVGSQSKLFGQPNVQSQPGPTQPTIKEHQTPTVIVTGASTLTPGPTVSPSPTSGPTLIKGAKLTVCGWSQYNSGWIIPICGHGFKGVSKVWLAVEYRGSNTFKLSGPYLVNSNGDFETLVGLYCKSPAVVIFAADKAQQPLTLPMTYTAKSSCYQPNPNVTPGSHP